MKLSFIIVDHNAKSGLMQSMLSLKNSCYGIDHEFFIVKNTSSEEKETMLESSFPEAKFVINDSGSNLAAAANRALEQCSGEYILMVTPDTKCHTDSLRKMIAFMDEHPRAGGLTVRLLSHEGRFEPQTMRGLDKSWSAFFKFAGFARNLPKTHLYNRRKTEWAEEFRVTEIDIINSSCMFLRRSALADIGFFDERFFQYGYNIDLSYRMRLAGYKNFYFPKTYFIQDGAPQTKQSRWHFFRYFCAAIFIFAIKYFIRLPDLKFAGIPHLHSSSLEVK